MSNELSRCLDFGETTVRVTGDLELDGDYISRSPLRKWGLNKWKNATFLTMYVSSFHLYLPK